MVLVMATMRVAQISGPKGRFEIVERPIPEVAPGTVRIKVAACGVCHSDSLVKEGLWPGLQYPRVPGHEVAGTINAVGGGVAGWAPGQRVGVGWHGGYCGRCEQCRRGNLFACETQQVTGISFDGGYGEYMVAGSMQVSPMVLLAGKRSVKGWYSGTAIDSQDTLAFSARAGVRSMNETIPLERVSEAYDRMMSGKARFRVVLTMK